MNDMTGYVTGAIRARVALLRWLNSYTVKPVHTGMPWGQTFIPVWTGSGLERVFAFGRNKQQ